MSVKVNAEPICQNSTSIREVDLRQEMGPVRNQGGLGWCFGFTAADLLTHYRLKKKDISSVDQTNMVSAVGVSSLYNREFFSYYSPDKELLNKQYAKELASKKKISEVINSKKIKLDQVTLKIEPIKQSLQTNSHPNAIKSKPYLPSDLIPWDKFESVKSEKLKIKLTEEAQKKIEENLSKTGSFLEAYAMYFKSLNDMSSLELNSLGISTVRSSGFIADAIIASKNGYCTESEARSGDISTERFDLKAMLNTLYDSTGKNNIITCANLINIQKLTPTLELRDIFKVLRHEEKAQAYQSLMANVCKRKFSNISNPVVGGWGLSANYIEKEQMITEAQIELINRMDKILDSGTPVGINYYNDFLFKSNGGFLWAHASSIVGKRVNPKTCVLEYILRNSYGTGCSLYKKPNSNYVSCIAGSNSEKNEKRKNQMKSDCDHQNIPEFINPKVSCEESSGYLFVEKLELGRYLTGITFLKE